MCTGVDFDQKLFVGFRLWGSFASRHPVAGLFEPPVTFWISCSLFLKDVLSMFYWKCLLDIFVFIVTLLISINRELAVANCLPEAWFNSKKCQNYFKVRLTIKSFRCILTVISQLFFRNVYLYSIVFTSFYSQYSHEKIAQITWAIHLITLSSF